MSSQVTAQGDRFSVEDLIDLRLIDEALPLFRRLQQDAKKIEDEADKILEKFDKLEKKLDKMIEKPESDPKKKKEKIKELREEFKEFVKEQREVEKAKIEFLKKHKKIPDEITLKNRMIEGARGLLSDKLFQVILEALEEVLK